MIYFGWTRTHEIPSEIGFFRLFYLVLKGQFVLSTIFGWVVLHLVRGLFRSMGFEGDLLQIDHIVLVSAIVCAVACGLMAYLLQILRIRRSRKLGIDEADIRSLRRVARVAALAGMLCGAICVVYLLVPITLFPLLLVALVLVVVSIRVFLQRAMTILTPGNYAEWSDAAHLLFIYGNLIALFTLVTLVLQVGAVLFSGLPFEQVPDLPYGSGIRTVLDALYFSIVVMTTLGFGDITPKVPLAKIVVIVQCASSYLLFALMVGIFTRGILSRETESPQGPSD